MQTNPELTSQVMSFSEVALTLRLHKLNKNPASNEELAENIKSACSALPSSTISTLEAAQIVTELCPTYYEKSQTSEDLYVYYFYDPDKRTVSNSIDRIRWMVSKMAFVKKIADEASFADKLHNKLQIEVANLGQAKPLNRAPKHLWLFDNCIGNFEKKEFYKGEKVTELLNTYQFFTRIPWNLVDKPDFLGSAVNDRLLDDWSDGDEQVKLLLKQISVAKVDGDGRGVYIIIDGKGGNGKTSFIQLNINLGVKQTALACNIQDLIDDETVNKINNNTTFIHGDELISDYRLTGKALSRYKSITDGGEFQVSKKYFSNLTISTNCLKLQATNTDVKFHEKNSAISDRTLFIPWGQINRRKQKGLSVNEKELDLKELLGLSRQNNYTPDRNLHEAYLYDLFYNVEPFETFVEPTTSKLKKQQVILESDNMYNFLSDLQRNEVFSFNKIPLSVLQKLYDLWLKENNESSSKMSSQTFTKRLKDMEDIFEFSVSDDFTRISSIDYLDFDFDILKAVYSELPTVDKYKMTKVIAFNNKSISQKEIDSLINKLPSNPSLRERIVAKHIILSDIKADNLAEIAEIILK